MDAAKSVTANFSAVVSTYALNVTVAGSGSGAVGSSPGPIDCPGTCSGSYVSGTVVTLTATPSAGSTFAGWSGACSGTSLTCMVTMNAVKNVTATFDPASPPSFTLTVSITGAAHGAVSSSPAGINCINGSGACAASYVSGTLVTLTAMPDGTKPFGGWSGACTGTSTTCVVTMDQARAVTAAFTP
jgi:hypothetical protein